MGDAGGPGSARKCPGVALADLGDTEGFDKGGKDGVYKRKRVIAQEGGEAQKLGELSDVDVSYAVPRRLHTLAFYWEQMDGLCRPRTTDGVADRHSNLLSLRRNRAATQGSKGDE